MQALIFDCDGVLVDTERDGHRVAFNRAFAEEGLQIEWDEKLYGDLLKVSGGKERMRYFFETYDWPEEIEDRDAYIRKLHGLKTSLFMTIIEQGELPLRSGVKRLVDEAIKRGIRLGVCSTSNEKAVNMVVEKMLGSERRKYFEFILAGDVVSRKKPDPEIYDLAKKRLELSPSQCIVIEDSRNGLLAAKKAGMGCIVTKSYYTVDEDFSEADRILDELGDPPGECVRLEDILAIAESVRS